MKKIAFSLLLSVALSTSVLGSTEPAKTAIPDPAAHIRGGHGGCGNWGTAQGSLGRLKDTLETLTKTCVSLTAKIAEAGLSGDLGARANAEVTALEGLKTRLQTEHTTLESIAAVTPDQKVGMRNYWLLNPSIAASAKVVDELIRIHNGTAKKTLEEKIADALGKIAAAKVTLDGLRDPTATAQTSLDFTAGELDRLATALTGVAGNKDLQKAYLESIENLLRGIENSTEPRAHHEKRRKARGELGGASSEGKM